MSYIRQYPLDEGATYHINKIGNIINSHNITTGYGIKITNTSQGKKISSNILPKNDAALWKGEYDPTFEYFPYDMIFVNSASVYNDPANSGSTLTLTPGTYICTNHIPTAWNDYNAFVAVIGAYGQPISDDMANNFRWYQFNNYTPVTNSFSQTSTTYGAYTIQASQSFWQSIGGFSQPVTGGGWNYRGLFNPSFTYNVNDVVSMGTGTAAGMFLCMIPNNVYAPDSGIGWVQISTSAGTFL